MGFAMLAFAASPSFAQGVPALRQAPIGHRQPTQSGLPPDVQKDEQLPTAASQRPGVSSPRHTGPTRGGGPPILQVGPSCEVAGRGAVVLGRNKESCLADETVSQDTLKQNWSKYVASDKSDCLGMVTTGGPASYVELLSCVEILRDARNIRNADALESDNESVSIRRSRDNRRPVRVRRRHPT
jgi:hypothetical protein